VTRPRITSTCILALLLSACQAAPRQRPIELGPVDTGAGSLEAARRQLQGEWSLVALETPESSGELTRIAATGVLTYDEYGNFTITGRVEDPRASRLELERMLTFTGRAVVDPRRQELRLIENTGKGDRLAGTPIALDRVRRYAFDKELLRISTVDANGSITATTTWQRRR
jgi:hypothetical protein